MRFVRFSILFILACIAAYAQRASAAAAVISEVFWMGSGISTADEWVELAGVDEVQDIGGWTLTTLAGNGEEVVMVRFPEGTMMQAGEFLVVSNFGVQDSCLLSEPAIVTAAVALPNSKLLLRLYDASGALVDQADDGIGEPFAGINASGTGTRASMERIDLALPGDRKENWQSARGKIGLDEECAVLGTPGYGREEEDTEDSSVSSTSFSFFSSFESSESSFSFSSFSSSESSSSVSSQSFESSASSASAVPSIYITEILANPAGTDDAEWVEIANLGTESIDIAGWILKLESASKGYAIPEAQAGSGLLLPAGQHMVLHKTKTGISLRNAGDTVVLMNGGNAIRTLFYPETAEGVSYGLDPYDPSHSMRLCLPTPGAANQLSSIDVSISIQSHTGESMEKGVISGVGKVSVNLEARSPHSLKNIACSWNFGDGETSDSCNPGAHVYAIRGAYGITLQAIDQCGSVSSDELAVFIEEAEQETKEAEETKEDSSSSVSLVSSQSVADLSCIPSAFSGIAISEFLPNPQGDDTAGEWIELINQTGQAAQLCGWSVDDAQEGSKPFALDGLKIGAHGFLLLPRSQTKIALNNSDDAVRLFAPTASGNFLLAEVPYGKVKEGESYALTGSGAYAWTAEPTPGYLNKIQENPKYEILNSKPKTNLKIGVKPEQKNYTITTPKPAAKSTVASSLLKTAYRNMTPWMTEEEEPEETPESHRYLAQALFSAADTPLPVPPDAQKGGGELVFVLIANVAGAALLLAKKVVIDKL